MTKEEELRQEICDIGKRIFDRNMVAANDGNISVRLNDHEILCTPTGISKGDMLPDCICKIDNQGNILEAAEGYRPSSEVKMHLKVYEKRPEINAVVHAHPAFATSFAIEGIPLNRPIMSEAVVSLGCVPIAPYGMPSTVEIPDAIAPFVPYFEAILLEYHGALTWAENLLEAYYHMESVELYAELLYKTRMLGGKRELNADIVHRLCKMREKNGGRNPEDVCLNRDLNFESCRGCVRHWSMQDRL